MAYVFVAQRHVSYFSLSGMGSTTDGWTVSRRRWRLHMFFASIACLPLS